VASLWGGSREFQIRVELMSLEPYSEKNLLAIFQNSNKFWFLSIALAKFLCCTTLLNFNPLLRLGHPWWLPSRSLENVPYATKLKIKAKKPLGGKLNLHNPFHLCKEMQVLKTGLNLNF
jgi:hypothetical protein